MSWFLEKHQNLSDVSQNLVWNKSGPVRMKSVEKCEKPGSRDPGRRDPEIFHLPVPLYVLYNIISTSFSHKIIGKSTRMFGFTGQKHCFSTQTHFNIFKGWPFVCFLHWTDRYLRCWKPFILQFEHIFKAWNNVFSIIQLVTDPLIIDLNRIFSQSLIKYAYKTVRTSLRIYSIWLQSFHRSGV